MRPVPVTALTGFLGSGIVTLVDAKHAALHVDDGDECKRGAHDFTELLWQPRTNTSRVGYAFLDDQIGGLAWQPEHRSAAALDAAGHVGCWQPPA